MMRGGRPSTLAPRPPPRLLREQVCEPTRARSGSLAEGDPPPPRARAQPLHAGRAPAGGALSSPAPLGRLGGGRRLAVPSPLRQHTLAGRRGAGRRRKPPPGEARGSGTEGGLLPCGVEPWSSRAAAQVPAGQAAPPPQQPTKPHPGSPLWSLQPPQSNPPGGGVRTRTRSASRPTPCSRTHVHGHTRSPRLGSVRRGGGRGRHESRAFPRWSARVEEEDVPSCGFCQGTRASLGGAPDLVSSGKNLCAK